jgi:hypothetical protein
MTIRRRRHKHVAEADRWATKGDAMRLSLRSAIIGVVLLSPGSASASEQVDICAVYSNTGKSYHVPATAISGSELNQRTQSFNYNSLGHYVVIFWSQGEATVIEMSGITGIPSSFQESGTDQEGRLWQISAYSSFVCGFQ